MNEYDDGDTKEAIHADLPVPPEFASDQLKYRALLFVTLITAGECELSP